LVSLSKEHGESHREEREGTPDRVAYGVLVQWKEVPVKGRVFKRLAPDGDMDRVLTTDLDETVTAQVVDAFVLIIAAQQRNRLPPCAGNGEPPDVMNLDCCRSIP
jgi:hypothetical protein